VTRPSKKNLERHFVEEAAKRLGKLWSLGPDREHPDFIVTEGGEQFGLEVCEIFVGRENRGGSVDKKGESDTQRRIDAIRHEYEVVENIPLAVKFVGDLCADNMVKVVPALLAKNIVSKAVGHRVVIDIDTGLRSGLRVHVTKGLRADWLGVKDRVGWVDYNPMPRITASVGKKSQELSRYNNAAGSDIRLLVVANRIHNSGKLTLEGLAPLDKRGFQAVYFFSYPESVVVFD
jgi:hypothetical protein